MLDSYITLGRSGLRVSPLCLGTMTFGTESGWGLEEPESRALFDHYTDRGGNFFDCANSYAAGTSEALLGKFVKDSGARDRAVIATKFTRCVAPGNPNAVGNGRKAMMLSLDQSLKRLQTDYIDLYWMHSWDGITPVEEVLDSLDELVRTGKIRYFGLSDVPAWYAARFQTLAEQAGRSRCVALQMEYSLIERGIEREHLPAMQVMGMALCAWSPTASGFLTGKYRLVDGQVIGAGRLATAANQYERFTLQNWRVLKELVDIAAQLGQTPAQVALKWVADRPGSTAPIIGARSLDQLRENLAIDAFSIPADLEARLDAVGKPALIHPYLMYEPPVSEMLGGGSTTRAWMPAVLR